MIISLLELSPAQPVAVLKPAASRLPQTPHIDKYSPVVARRQRDDHAGKRRTVKRAHRIMLPSSPASLDRTQIRPPEALRSSRAAATPSRVMATAARRHSTGKSIQRTGRRVLQTTLRRPRISPSAMLT
jgi:hypothetical protein